MKKKKELSLAWIALIWIAVSVISMFISVVSYEEAGVKKTYAIQDLVSGPAFSSNVLAKYSGPFQMKIGNWALTALCVLAVLAIVAAVVGLVLLSKQRSVRWPFVMTVIGVVGTAIPALLILAATALSVAYFPGTILPGLYPILTPIAVIFSLVLVAKERKRILKAKKLTMENALIRPAGDLV